MRNWLHFSYNHQFIKLNMALRAAREQKLLLYNETALIRHVVFPALCPILKANSPRTIITHIYTTHTWIFFKSDDDMHTKA